jgi:hypothetical protein
MLRSISRASGVLTAILAILAIAACSGSDAAGPQSQSISITVSPADVTVLCGATGVTTATLTRNGGFDGVVSVSVSGLPPGVTASLSSSELAGTDMSTMITIVAEEAANPGSYTITVKAASSVGSVTTTYTLVIVEAPRFQLSVEPSVLTVLPGGRVMATVRITRSGGFSGNVALSVTGATSGLTVTFDPAIVTKTASTVTLSVAPTAPTGRTVLMVVGAADALPTATSSIALDVGSQPLLVAEPSELTVVRGGHGRTEVSVVPAYELGGWATYSLVAPPSGISATFEYHFDGGYPATATISVPSTVAPGRYMLTLGVTFPAIATLTTMIGLTVIDP